MYFSKKNVEPIPEEQTAVWMCSKDKCMGWMREDYAFDKIPVCPFCQSTMTKNTKMLPALNNTR